MSENFKQVLEDVKQLNPSERALVAHCLISSLETEIDEEVDLAWAELAEQRYNDILSGKVKPVTWDEIKKKIKD